MPRPLSVKASVKLIGKIVTIDAVIDRVTPSRIGLEQIRFLTYGKVVSNSQLPALIQSMIQPKLNLMRVVKRVDPQIITVVVVIKRVIVTKTKIRLPQREIYRNIRRNFSTPASLLAAGNSVIIIVETTQSATKAPCFGRQDSHVIGTDRLNASNTNGCQPCGQK